MAKCTASALSEAPHSAFELWNTATDTRDAAAQVSKKRNEQTSSLPQHSLVS